MDKQISGWDVSAHKTAAVAALRRLACMQRVAADSQFGSENEQAVHDALNAHQWGKAFQLVDQYGLEPAPFVARMVEIFRNSGDTAAADAVEAIMGLEAVGTRLGRSAAVARTASDKKAEDPLEADRKLIETRAQQDAAAVTSNPTNERVLAEQYGQSDMAKGMDRDSEFYQTLKHYMDDNFKKSSPHLQPVLSKYSDEKDREALSGAYHKAFEDEFFKKISEAYNMLHTPEPVTPAPAPEPIEASTHKISWHTGSEEGDANLARDNEVDMSASADTARQYPPQPKDVEYLPGTRVMWAPEGSTLTHTGKVISYSLPATENGKPVYKLETDDGDVEFAFADRVRRLLE